MGSNWVQVQGQLSAKRYDDPKGYFVIVPPYGWRIQEYPQDPRGKVVFIATESNVDLRILINAVDFTSTEEFLNWCKDFEDRIGLNTNIEKIDLDGEPAVRRSFEIKGLKLYMIDFLVGSIDHNIQFAAPINTFEKYFPIVKNSIETYEAKNRVVTDKDKDKHYVAKMLRLAQLMIDNGNYVLALAYVREGLDISPNDKKLSELKNLIESKQ